MKVDTDTRNFILRSIEGVCLCILLLLLAGRAQAAEPIAWRDDVPPEESCTLHIVVTLTAKEVDGEKVDWKAKRGASWVTVQIPEGSHTFIVDYDREVGMNERHYQKDLMVRYDHFEAGRTYVLVAAGGPESRGFSGMFKDIVGSMMDTVNKVLRIGVKDVTDEPKWASKSNWQEGVEWLPVE